MWKLVAHSELLTQHLRTLSLLFSFLECLVMRQIRFLAALMAVCLVGGVATATTQTLTYGIFTGGGPGSFNFSDNGTVNAITLDAGGTTVSGPTTVLYQGGAGDSTFFYDHTAAGETFVANGNSSEVVNSAGAAVAAVGDPVGVAVDEVNGYLFYTSRGAGEVYRAPLAPDGTVGASSVFLSGLTEPASLHFTSGSRLLVGEAGRISSVDPTNAASLTPLVTDIIGQTRGLEEDVANGTIYYSTDESDIIAKAPSAGGASTTILSGSGSFQDILLDELNDRIILANFAVSNFFDTDGEIISYAWDPVAGTITDGGVTLLDQAGIVDPPSNNAYFTGLGFLPVIPEPSTGLLLVLGAAGLASRRN